MTRVQARPYLVSEPERASILTWTRFRGDESIPLTNSLDDWDPETNLHTAAELFLDRDGIWSDCQLPETASLAAVLTWSSPGTSIRGRGMAVPVTRNAEVDVLLLECKITGADLGRQLLLEVQIVLAEDGPTDNPMSASQMGSLIWSNARTILLEGQATRFPTQWVDFTTSPGLPDEAAWYLDWDDFDLESLALGSIRLLLNSNNATVQRAVAAANPGETELLVLDTIRFDVARTLITGALSNQDFVADPDQYEDESVGETLRRLLAVTFPGQNASALAEAALRNPSRFEATLKSSLRFLAAS